MLAWTLATGAAVTLSRWGVHTVMAGTAYGNISTTTESLFDRICLSKIFTFSIEKIRRRHCPVGPRIIVHPEVDLS